jgi:hypothetical protein
MLLPEPADLTSLVVRTDFSDDAAWVKVRSAINELDEYSPATFFDDPRMADATVEALVADAADMSFGHLFVADTMTMTDSGRSLLVVDLFDEPGRTFRVPVRWFMDISANLTIANMSFWEFADSCDDTGTYHGFE